MTRQVCSCGSEDSVRLSRLIPRVSGVRGGVHVGKYNGPFEGCSAGWGVLGLTSENNLVLAVAGHCQGPHD